MCFQCYQSDDSRHSHQRFYYNRDVITTVEREQCPVAHQTKQVPIPILHH